MLNKRQFISAAAGIALLGLYYNGLHLYEAVVSTVSGPSAVDEPSGSAPVLRRDDAAETALTASAAESDKESDKESPDATASSAYRPGWMNVLSEPMGKYLFDLLDKLGNPENCSTARLLVKTETFDAGFGSNMHGFAQGLTMALHSNRTYVISPGNWGYCPKAECPTGTIDCFYLPPSKCVRSDALESECIHVSEENITVLQNPQRVWEFKWTWSMRHWYFRNYKDIRIDSWGEWANYTLLMRQSLGIERWLWNHIVAYLMRPNPTLQAAIEKRRFDTNLGLYDFSIGLQIRHGDRGSTDKLGMWNLKEYMAPALRWLSNQTSYSTDSSVYVYIMTDDEQIRNETIGWPERFHFVMREEIEDTTNNQITGLPYQKSLQLLVDIHVIAECDYIVCTRMSNLGDLILELSASYRPSQNVWTYICQLEGTACYADNTRD